MVARSFLAALAVSTSIVSVSSAHAQEVLRQKAPEWVRDRDATAPAEESGAAADLYLLDSQARVDGERLQTYLKMVMRPNNRAGLQQVGTVYFPWVSARGPAYLHELTIHRDGQVIDRLADTDIRIVDQQQQLANSMLDGIKTIMIPVPGLQVGDEVHVAYGFEMRKELFGLPPEQLFLKMELDSESVIYQRLIASDEDGVRVRLSPQYGKVEGRSTRYGTAYDVRIDRLDNEGKIKPAKKVAKKTDDEEEEESGFPAHAPAENMFGFFQAAPYADWSDAAASMRPFYADVRDIDPDGDLAAAADRIMAEHSTPEARMMEALRVVQEDVRYVAILLGQGAYTPEDPEAAWRNRAADCKASTAILMALLERMGIRNDAMLVRSSQGAILGKSLPSLMLFDHVIARAHIGSETFYLDGTGFGQVRTEEVEGTDFEYGLPLVENATLTKLPRAMGSIPDRHFVVEWDGSKGMEGELPFTASIRLAGANAALVRASLSEADSRDSRDSMLKSIVPSIPNEDIEIVEFIDRAPDGTLLIRYSGATDPNWEEATSFDGVDEDEDSGERFRMSAVLDASDWPIDFDREEGPYRDWDVHLGSPYWETGRETFILPAGSGEGFTTEAMEFDETLGGAKLVRTITRDGDRIEIATEFRTRVDRISAADARAAQERIDELNDDDIYLYSPVGFEPTDNEEDGEEGERGPPIIRIAPSN